MNGFPYSSSLCPAFDDCVPVVFASDSNYVPYVAVAIRSIINQADANRNYDILVLAAGDALEREHDLAALADNCENVSIRMVDMSPFCDYVKKLHLSTHVTSAAYYRLFITEICAAYDKILYLDCDVLCVRDIAGLYDVAMGDKLVAGAHDEGIRSLSHRWLDEACEYLRGLGMNNPKDCFNSGVLVMNLKQMRAEDMLTRFCAVAEKNQKYWHDQSVLNVCCQDRVLYVPEKWNYTSHMYMGYFFPTAMVVEAERMNAERDYCVIHYANPNKPWKMLESPLSFEWWKVAFQTNFIQEIKRKTLAFHQSRLGVKSWVKLIGLMLVSTCVRTKRMKAALAQQMDRMGVSLKAVEDWEKFWSTLLE